MVFVMPTSWAFRFIELSGYVSTSSSDFDDLFFTHQEFADGRTLQFCSNCSLWSGSSSGHAIDLSDGRT